MKLPYNFFMEVEKMNNYITGKIIKELRERKQITQMELSEVIGS